METRILPASQPGALEQAIAAVRRGEPLAFPTDTVYGLGVLVHDRAGIDRLYAIKERDSSKPIAVLVADAGGLSVVAGKMNPMARRLAERFWPGPLTLVVPVAPSLPDNLSDRPTVGVRMPDHPVALALLRQAGPMAVTSANLSGASSSASAQEVAAQLGGRVSLILDGGQTPGGQASSVVDCTGEQPVVLRAGPISLEDLLAALH